MLAGFARTMQDGDPIELALQLLGGLYTPASPPHLRVMHDIVTSGTAPHVAVAMLSAEAEGHVSHDYLLRRTCPVLAFYASPTLDADFSATTAEKRVEAEMAVSRHAASRVVLWKGTGHWLQQERSAEFNEMARSWIAGVVAES
jgi:pimeloyl-ACP methyl ester carboxylesterase